MNFPPPQKCDYIVKIVTFGAKQSGKTNILSRLCYDDFTGVYKETVGIDFFIKNFTLAEKKIKLQFWDIEVTPKSEGEKVREMCCRGVIGLIVVYSIVDSSSFDFAQQLLSTGLNKDHFGNDVVKFLIANKSDLGLEAKVGKQLGEKLAKENNMIFMETSAKDCTGMKELGLRLGTELLNIIKNHELR